MFDNNQLISSLPRLGTITDIMIIDDDLVLLV